VVEVFSDVDANFGAASIPNIWKVQKNRKRKRKNSNVNFI
jgi:hypothetical protein